MRKWKLTVKQRNGFVREYHASECITLTSTRITSPEGRVIDQSGKHVGSFFSMADVKEFFKLAGHTVIVEEEGKKQT